jgi:hypothetical protein
VYSPETDRALSVDHSLTGTRSTQQRFDHLTPTTTRYATLPVLEGFNWSECLAGVEGGRWYLVVFRSIRRADADERLLTEHDDLAYAEALAGQGLLHYFRGALNERRECLSLCLWEHQHQARQASHLPLHIQAARISRDMYETYVVERFHLIKRPGASALEVEPAV